MTKVISKTYINFVYFRPRNVRGTILGDQPSDVDLHPENKGGAVDEFSEDSMASGSSGFGSLPRGKQRTSLVPGTVTAEEPAAPPTTTTVTVTAPVIAALPPGNPLVITTTSRKTSWSYACFLCMGRVEARCRKARELVLMISIKACP